MASILLRHINPVQKLSLARALGLTTVLALISACESVSSTSPGPSQSAVKAVAGVVAPSAPSLTLPALTVYQFATPEEAGDILATTDDYTDELQAIEIGIKNKDANKTSLSSLQENYRNGVLAWTDEDRQAVIKVTQSLQEKLRPYSRHLPAEVLIGKISDRVEGGLPHTRANLILLSAAAMQGYHTTTKTDPDKALASLQALFLHELHHILSRHNSQYHDDYYGVIGFKPCTFNAPEELRSRRLTNPDAPTYKHYAPIDGTEGDGVIPYLYVKGPYAPETGYSLGDYFSFGLLVVDEVENQCTPTNGTTTLLSPDQAPAFIDLIGKNTGYIIHPEETLADNFTYLIMGREDLPNPEIPPAIGAFWNELE